VNGAEPVQAAIKRNGQPAVLTAPQAATAERAAGGVSLAYKEGEHDWWALR
jgi:hypothetical protein